MSAEVTIIKVVETNEVTVIKTVETSMTTVIKVVADTSAKGDKGDKGDPGDNGADGAQGPPGSDGIDATNNTLEQVRAENNVIEGDINANGNTILGVREAVDDTEVVPFSQVGDMIQAAQIVAAEEVDVKIGEITLEQVRSVNETIGGNIDANGNTMVGMRNASDPQEAATLNQVEAALQEAKAYSDTVSSITVRSAGFWDATGGVYPSGTIGGVKFGYEYEASNVLPVSMPDGQVVEKGDLFRARITNPGQNPVNWYIGQGNNQQATEGVQGTMKIAEGATVGDTTSLNDTDAVTTKKLWLSFVPSFLLTNWIWGALQTFTISPRITTLGVSMYVKSNLTNQLVTVSTIPAADIAPDTNHRFVTDAEKTTWNGKQDAIGYVPQESLQNWDGRKGVYIHEDFIGYNGGDIATSTGLITTRTGTGASMISASGYPNRVSQQGVWYGRTGTTAAGMAGMLLGNQSLFYSGGAGYYETYVCIETLTTSAERFHAFVGWNNNSNFFALINSIMFIYDEGAAFGFGGATSASPNWQVICRNGVGVAKTVTSVPVVAGQWYKLRININAAGTIATFYINNALVATHSNTELPSQATPLNLSNYIVKSVGTSTRGFFTDWVEYYQLFNTPQ